MPIMHRPSNASPRANSEVDGGHANSPLTNGSVSRHGGAGGGLRPTGAHHHKHPSQDHSNVNFHNQPRKSIPARNATGG